MRQLDLFSGLIGATLVHVDDKVTKLEPAAHRLRVLEPRAPQVRRHPRDELAQAQRLGDVIIRADLQRDHRVDLVRPRAHHDHGHAGIHLAKLAADVKPRHVRQRDLEEHDVWARALNLAQGFGAGVGLDDLIAVLLANLLDLPPRRAVRLHDKDLAGSLRHSHQIILT